MAAVAANEGDDDDDAFCGFVTAASFYLETAVAAAAAAENADDVAAAYTWEIAFSAADADYDDDLFHPQHALLLLRGVMEKYLAFL